MTISNAPCHASDHWAKRLLDSEQQSLVRLLHDDLGQNLVAIKSFAAAIASQNADAADDTSELAGMIREAAESAYRSSYDLMQELRAQYMADRELGEALQTCLEESRLKENRIDYRCRVDAALPALDASTRAFVLRAVRCVANLSKALDGCKHFSIDLGAAGKDAGRSLELTFELGGSSDTLDPDHFSLVSLAERLAAIGGEMRLEADAGGKTRLVLRFDPLESDSGAES